jgi:hypothetical protein
MVKNKLSASPKIKQIFIYFYVLLLSINLFAWNGTFQGRISYTSWASLLGLLAFSTLWIWQLAEFLKSHLSLEPAQLDLKKEGMVISKVLVFTVLVHPALIIYWLYKKGYGLPPQSYIKAFGGFLAIFISLGFISLIFILLSQFKKTLKLSPKFKKILGYMADLALVLVILHGFKLGLTVAGWFKYVWLAYGLSLNYFYYHKYILSNKFKESAVPFIVALGLISVYYLSLV